MGKKKACRIGTIKYEGGSFSQKAILKFLAQCWRPGWQNLQRGQSPHHPSPPINQKGQSARLPPPLPLLEKWTTQGMEAAPRHTDCIQMKVGATRYVLKKESALGSAYSMRQFQV